MSLDAWSVLWEALAALGTMGAVVWAVYTTVTESRKRAPIEKELSEEKAASRLAKRREQAEHVAVWFEVHYLSMALGDTSHSTAHGSVLVGNYSGAPIFKVSVSGEAVLVEQRFQFGFATVVPPGAEPWSTNLGEAAEHTGELLLHVEFQDVAGVWWRRSSGGGLEEMPNPIRHPLP